MAAVVSGGRLPFRGGAAQLLRDGVLLLHLRKLAELTSVLLESLVSVDDDRIRLPAGSGSEYLDLAGDLAKSEERITS